MPSPKHLWTGNWEEESAAAAARRARRALPAEPLTEPEPPPLRERKGRRRLTAPRAALVVPVVALLIVGAAYAARSLDSSSRSAAPTQQPAWLGAQLETWPPSGALVAAVIPGSPAQAGGLRAGDVITQVEGRPVGAAVNVTAAVAALRAGDELVLEIQRGGASHSVRIKLAARQSGSPYP